MNEFKLGYVFARDNGDDRSKSIEGCSKQFLEGYTQFMREAAFLDGNPDTDSFDY